MWLRKPHRVQTGRKYLRTLQAHPRPVQNRRRARAAMPSRGNVDGANEPGAVWELFKLIEWRRSRADETESQW